MTENTQNFVLQKIYIKDISFESPKPEEYFTQSLQPQVNLELNTESKTIEDNVYEVTLNINVTATLEKEDEEKSTMYLVEIKQAGIFNISGFEEKDLHRTINSYCPNLLFPYAREAISSLVERGGFPQLLLAPINFDSLYEHHLEKLKQAEKNPPSDSKH